MSENHELGAGDVPIELEGHGELVLKPTLKAAMALTNGKGGVPALVDRCLNYELNALVQIISVGIDDNSKDLPEIIYQTGMLKLAPQCIEYLHIIANGGKPVSDETPDEGGDTPLGRRN